MIGAPAVALGGLSARSLQGGGLDVLAHPRASLRASHEVRLALQPANPLALRPSTANVAAGLVTVPGLANLGNTCYMNSIFQALAAVPCFAEFALVETSSPSAARTRPVLVQLQQLVSRLNAGRGTPPSEPVNPSSLVRALCFDQPPRTEQDAHEFLSHVANMLSDEMRAQRPAVPSLTQLIDEPSSQAIASSSSTSFALQRGGIRSSTSEVAAAPRTPLEGMLTSRITCEACGYASPLRGETSHVLSLMLPPRGGLITIDSLLASHFTRERIDSYACPQCTARAAASKAAASRDAPPPSASNSPGSADDPLPSYATSLSSSTGAASPPSSTGKSVHRRATRQSHFSRLPRSLCLHLSRVHYDGGQLWKNEAVVAPADPLNMAPYVRVGIPAPMPRLYRLVALVVHLGNERGGHFVTYRRMGAAALPALPPPAAAAALTLRSASVAALPLKRHQMTSMMTSHQGGGYWLRISDEAVRVAPASEVFSAEAYLLFYERIG